MRGRWGTRVEGTGELGEVDGRGRRGEGGGLGLREQVG